MDSAQAIEAFRTAGNVLPAEAMQWALDQWDKAGPPLRRIVEDYAASESPSREDADAAFFALHLIGGAGDTTAFPAICGLLHNAEASEQVLGDAIPETLRGILIRSFDGDAEKLIALVDDKNTNDFIRETALLVMGYLTQTGRIPEAQTREFLAALGERLDPEIDDVLVAGWALTVAYLGYEDLAPRVEAVLKVSGMGYPAIGPDEFRDELRARLADPTGLAGFEHEHITPLDDPIATLSQWHSFSGEAGQLDDEQVELDPNTFWDSGLEGTYVNPLKHVGRNDPCPCGSGKKYKKCCLLLA